MGTYNRNGIIELLNRGYSKKQVAIVFGCIEETIAKVSKSDNEIEPTLKFLSLKEKQRLLVLDRLLSLKPVSTKWNENCYYYITILKFLGFNREQILSIYPKAPQKQVAQACKERSPIFCKFDYSWLKVNTEEWIAFVEACYKIIGDATKWR